ncbi:hypothetical protein HYU19_05635 [Candidatus Woesearchaeota archaeon]|nr:hypothetical protein [Candidatus Woesearchaeota archaeon]
MSTKRFRLLIGIIILLSLASVAVSALAYDPISMLSKAFGYITQAFQWVFGDMDKIGINAAATNKFLMLLTLLGAFGLYHLSSQSERFSQMNRNHRAIGALFISGVLVFGIHQTFLVLFGQVMQIVWILALIGFISFLGFSLFTRVWRGIQHEGWRRLICGIILFLCSMLISAFLGAPWTLFQQGKEWLAAFNAIIMAAGAILIVLGLFHLVAGIRGRGAGGGGGGGQGGGLGQGAGLGHIGPPDPFPDITAGLNQAGQQAAQQNIVDEQTEERFAALEAQLGQQQEALAQWGQQIAALQEQLQQGGAAWAQREGQLLDQLQTANTQFNQLDQERARMRQERDRMQQDFQEQLQRFQEDARRNSQEAGQTNQQAAQALLQEARQEYTRRQQLFEGQLQDVQRREEGVRQREEQARARLLELTNQLADASANQARITADMERAEQARVQTDQQMAAVTERLGAAEQQVQEQAEKLRKRGVPGAKETEQIEKEERGVTKRARRTAKREVKLDVKSLDALHQLVKSEQTELELTRAMIECLNPERLKQASDMDDKSNVQKIKKISEALLGQYKDSQKYRDLMMNLYRKAKDGVERERQSVYTLKNLRTAAQRSLNEQKAHAKRA